MSVRRLGPEDHAALLALLAHLHPHPPAPEPAAFRQLLAHPGTSLWGFDRDGTLSAIATLHVLPNLTHGGRPYGLVENVVTAPEARGLGDASAVMTAIRDHACASGAYKLMLLSGRARQARGFYERLGYSSDEKHGLILRLK